ncbi:hypothetical protein K466DRAFT_569975 [Polyporus arcularius HHB13444]|uniref:Uncharacterized protein n=1 Tax=Polyporus arcularius HHB13444 TaxID=1314778 RepID=A0A5C3NV60_9APHY|nr:hypothetical protein K466DRAFT_569975 [Polyporus arcularius HHB13444]
MWSAGTSNGAAMGAGWGPMYTMSGAQLSYGNAPIPFGYHMSSGPQLSLSVGHQLASLDMNAGPQHSFGDQLVDFELPVAFQNQSSDFSYNELFTDLGPLLTGTVPSSHESDGIIVPTAGALLPVTNQQPAHPATPAQLPVPPEVIALMQPSAAAVSSVPAEPPTEPPAPVTDFIDPVAAQPEALAPVTTRTGRVSRAPAAPDVSYSEQPKSAKPKPRPVKKNKTAAEEGHPEAPAAKKKKTS